MTHPKPVVRAARREDCEAIATLASELREALGEPRGLLTGERILADGFGPSPEFELLLAEFDGEAVGYALYMPTYEPAYGARGLFLADLYVRSAARGLGIGRSLFSAVRDAAARDGRVFVWWVSDPANARSESFYEDLGVQMQTLVKARAFVLVPVPPA